MQDEKLKVDVIIPTYKPDDRFNTMIERLLKQTYVINKIIIINTEKNCMESSPYLDGDNNKIEIHHISRNEFDHGITRNYGVSFSCADVVVFLSQDAVPAGKNLIEELLKPFSDEDVYVSYGRQVPRANCSCIESFTRQFNYPDKDIVKTKDNLKVMGIKTYFSSDVCAAYRRDKHIELGGFPRTLFNEDSIFASKVINMGKKVYYASKAVVIHSHNYTCMQQFHRNFDIGVSHREFREIFSNIKSENEGIKLVTQSAKYLIKIHKWYLIPDMIVKSAFKFSGYRLGKIYDRLPRRFVLKCTLSPVYWNTKNK